MSRSGRVLVAATAFALLGPARFSAAAAAERPSSPAEPGASASADSIPAPFPGQPAFRHRGFYFHCGWAFNHPFAPHSWSRADFAKAFELLRRMGFDTVMYWPQIEAIPAPISKEDAAALEDVRGIIADARAAGLRCWLTLTPNLTSPPEIAALPFSERNPFRTYRTVRLNQPEEREPFLAHRRAMLRTVNNADAYVTIDGDPGGYPGGTPEDFLRVFLADRATLDAYGADPKNQMVIPWIWAGWGRTEPLWHGDHVRNRPFSRARVTFAVRRDGLRGGGRRGRQAKGALVRNGPVSGCSPRSANASVAEVHSTK